MVLRPVLSSVVASLGWFLVLFAVPALPLRYGVNFGTELLSMAVGMVIVAAALWRGWDRHLIGQLAAAVVVGVVGALAGYVLARGYPEAKLLAAAVGFVLAAVGVCGGLDRRSVLRDSDVDIS